ncbi:hypothetical protein Sneaky_63 [Paenibacillus phage Sneaky]|uniref:Uncharacterized protein n=4 Tax=Fernvirus TaxID=2843380 RepID=A0A0K2CXV4_9CAUD|nr:hypothetical protein [Paenibacillus larvae]YP_009203259.1 hypothetical protein FERN_57 [Paenibacillus phage Fern]YP_009593466.1 hypothetical protein FDG84_gp57 [Paenibacillus phage Willow]YP_009838825.1 hypothetical protein HWB72_gp54 [Paenibacillus phage Lucielle]AXF40494.1 hypothetical protein SAUDAGE_54 [Paenibacillus phage Saudage]QVV19536.1 hypothetical protein Bohemia_62 [Paenibacillus phage Bohemia]QVV20327.1 hypothetical protein Sneaky_63 [Paenibacillus phage Sneaky]ALA12323.1 hyp
MVGSIKKRIRDGCLINKRLNTTLERGVYDAAKAFVWVGMINQGCFPIKWLKPTKQGTKIDYVCFQSKDEADRAADEAFDDLDKYIKQVNQVHGLNIELDIEE